MALTEVDDKALVQGHKSGDPSAFAGIVLAYRSSLYAHAVRRLRDPAAAEDAVQETLLRALRALPRFNGEYKLGAWLHRILTNVCLDEANRRRRIAHIAERVAAQPMPPAPAADHELVLDLPLEEMEAALRALPASHREALMMRVVEDRPYSEVAQATGVSEDNARARVSRARSALRSMLGSVVSGIAVLLPFVRRQPPVTTPVDTVAASTSTPAVSSSAAQAATQWGPMSGIAAQATDVAASAGPAIAGKIAVTVAAVAAVAMPTGAAITQSQREAPPPAAAEATTPTAQPDARAASDSIEALVVTGSELTLAAGSGEGEDDGTGEASSATTLAPTTTAADGAEAEAGEASTASETTTTDGSAEPAPARGAALSADGLEVTEAGPRLEVTGRATFDTGSETWAGQLAGKILVEEADPDDQSAPRRVDGTLTLTGDEGRSLEVRLGGTAVVTHHANGDRTYQFSGPFRLSGDDGGTDTEGDYEATLLQAHKEEDGSTLSISFNGGPATDDGTSTSTTTSTTAA